MAGFATHDIFGEEVLEQIPDAMLQSLMKKHTGVFGIGCQGPDLFLYNLPMQIGSAKKNLGSRMHREGSSRFFASLLWYIWNTGNYECMETGLSYFYGALSHYTLDSMVHPYVYARSGFDPEVPYSRKATTGIHHRLEAAIDAKVIAVKKEILPSNYQPLESITIRKQEKKMLTALLSRALCKSYHMEVRKENVTAAIRMMRIIACGFYGCSDKQKKRLERLEGTVLDNYLCSNYLVTDEYIRKRKIMNTEKAEWCNPWDVSVRSTDSVWEIYDHAVQQYQEYARILKPLISKYLRKWISLRHPYSEHYETMDSAKLWREICETVKKLGNLSYHSGLSV